VQGDSPDAYFGCLIVNAKDGQTVAFYRMCGFIDLPNIEQATPLAHGYHCPRCSLETSEHLRLVAIANHVKRVNAPAMDGCQNTLARVHDFL
jgi:hypothetical protein